MHIKRIGSLLHGQRGKTAIGRYEEAELLLNEKHPESMQRDATLFYAAQKHFGILALFFEIGTRLLTKASLIHHGQIFGVQPDARTYGTGHFNGEIGAATANHDIGNDIASIGSLPKRRTWTRIHIGYGTTKEAGLRGRHAKRPGYRRKPISGNVFEVPTHERPEHGSIRVVVLHLEQQTLRQITSADACGLQGLKSAKPTSGGLDRHAARKRHHGQIADEIAIVGHAFDSEHPSGDVRHPAGAFRPFAHASIPAGFRFADTHPGCGRKSHSNDGVKLLSQRDRGGVLSGNLSKLEQSPDAGATSHSSLSGSSL